MDAPAASPLVCEGPLLQHGHHRAGKLGTTPVHPIEPILTGMANGRSGAL
jgi:hypothetical protein